LSRLAARFCAHAQVVATPTAGLNVQHGGRSARNIERECVDSEKERLSGTLRGVHSARASSRAERRHRREQSRRSRWAYPSALHVRWVPPRSAFVAPVAALAVDNAPEVFWDDERRGPRQSLEGESGIRADLGCYDFQRQRFLRPVAAPKCLLTRLHTIGAADVTDPTRRGSVTDTGDLFTNAYLVGTPAPLAADGVAENAKEPQGVGAKGDVDNVTAPSRAARMETIALGGQLLTRQLTDPRLANDRGWTDHRHHHPQAERRANLGDRRSDPARTD
jgi:hypothetical protein